MKKNILSIALILLSLPVFSQTITRSWKGTLNAMGAKLPVVFNIEKSDTIYTATLDSPEQGAFGIPLSKITFRNDTLHIEASALGVAYTGVFATDSIYGTFSQGGFNFPLTLKKGDKINLVRPQTPTEPFPYRSEEVIFQNKEAKIDLVGTLTLPNSTDTFPAVILVAGSGPNDCDETILGHKPFLVLADYLTRKGIAVLRYDKRGVASSQGVYSTATTDDFAADAQAAFNFLLTRKEIIPTKIGIIGHSEGGIIAPMVAASNRHVAFVVLMAAMGVPGDSLMLKQNEALMIAQGVDLASLNKLQAINAETYRFLKDIEVYTDANRTTLKYKLSSYWENMPIRMRKNVKKEAFVQGNERTLSSRWFRRFLNIRPTEYLEKVRCPILAISGEKDIQIDAADNLIAIKNISEKTHHNNTTIKVYPNLNHLFQTCETGYPNEYGKIEETIAPEVLEDIAEWIIKNIP